MKTDNFFAELKRRNVYKVCGRLCGGGLAAISSSFDCSTNL